MTKKMFLYIVQTTFLPCSDFSNGRRNLKDSLRVSKLERVIAGPCCREVDRSQADTFALRTAGNFIFKNQ